MVPSDPSGIQIEEKTVEREYEVFRRMEFNSDRKRMSILVRDPDDGLIKLYTKGADSIIIDRLDPKQIDDTLMNEINAFLTETSNNGLRTLCMAMRVIEEEELQAFIGAYKAIEEELEGKDERLDELYSDFEQGLVLLGATAVEDMLQQDVP